MTIEEVNVKKLNKKGGRKEAALMTWQSLADYLGQEVRTVRRNQKLKAILADRDYWAFAAFIFSRPKPGAT